MEYGEPDGFGVYGQLDPDENGLLVCHDCGKPCRQLATHARLAHGYTNAEDYRTAHGLARKVRLSSPATSAKLSAHWDANRAWREEQLARVRRPHDIPNRGKGPLRAGALEGRSRGGASTRRDLTAEQIAALGEWDDIAEWTRRARALMAETGLGARAIGRAFGVTQGAVDGRLRRYL